jgi:hypothetical protein
VAALAVVPDSMTPLVPDSMMPLVLGFYGSKGSRF